MLIISFDAVGAEDFEQLSRCPAVAGLLAQSALYTDVSTVFMSNTYPAHTSIVTGATPRVHGVVSNVAPFPSRCPHWNFNERNIKAKTIWQAAAERGIDVASVFWPVTAYSATIRHNIPEVQARPGKSQLFTSLKAGSVKLQFEVFMKYRTLLDGIKQPNLDNFATACMAYILRKYKPGLALIHLTVFDASCHAYGKGGHAQAKAFETLDRNLAVLLEAAGPGRAVIVLSDHCQYDVHTVLEPNRALADSGLLLNSADGYRAGGSGCFFECCGGSAFFHAGSLGAAQTEAVRAGVAGGEGFRRFLTDGEMYESGRSPDAAFGFCARQRYAYGAFDNGEKAQHGYPPDMPGSNVFYAVRGRGHEPGGVTRGGSLLDVAGVASRLLGINAF